MPDNHSNQSLTNTGTVRGTIKIQQTFDCEGSKNKQVYFPLPFNRTSLNINLICISIAEINCTKAKKQKYSASNMGAF